MTARHLALLVERAFDGDVPAGASGRGSAYRRRAPSNSSAGAGRVAICNDSDRRLQIGVCPVTQPKDWPTRPARRGAIRTTGPSTEAISSTLWQPTPTCRASFGEMAPQAWRLVVRHCELKSCAPLKYFRQLKRGLPSIPTGVGDGAARSGMSLAVPPDATTDGAGGGWPRGYSCDVEILLDLGAFTDDGRRASCDLRRRTSVHGQAGSNSFLHQFRACRKWKLRIGVAACLSRRLGLLAGRTR